MNVGWVGAWGIIRGTEGRKHGRTEERKEGSTECIGPREKVF